MICSSEFKQQVLHSDNAFDPAISVPTGSSPLQQFGDVNLRSAKRNCVSQTVSSLDPGLWSSGCCVRCIVAACFEMNRPKSPSNDPSNLRLAFIIILIIIIIIMAAPSPVAAASSLARGLFFGRFFPSQQWCPRISVVSVHNASTSPSPFPYELQARWIAIRRLPAF